MICIKDNQQGAEILTDYCAGRLDPARASELGIHLQECAECRKLTEAQTEIWGMLDVALKPIEVSPDFDTKLYARIAQERREPAWRRWWLEGIRRILRPAAPRPLWKPVASLAAVAAVVFLAVTRMPYSTGQAQNEPSRPIQLSSERLSSERLSSERLSSENIDVDQVEQALEDMDMLAPVGQASSGKLSSSKL